MLNRWLYLILAIVLEVIGTTAMKLSDGLTRLGPTVAMALCYAGAFVAMAIAIKRIDVSVAYAIWAGVGTALIAVIGMAVFDEPLTWFKLVCLALIIAGVVGLELA